MIAFFLLIGFLLASGLFLLVENRQIRRSLSEIPLRIAVTGTRGKTSAVRLLRAMLAVDGRKVLAKTTGQRAMMLLPDGVTVPIKRRGGPTILEQKAVAKRAAALNVDVLIAEMMSIHNENQFVEYRQLLRPHIVVLGNEMGEIEQEYRDHFMLLKLGAGGTRAGRRDAEHQRHQRDPQGF